MVKAKIAMVELVRLATQLSFVDENQNVQFSVCPTTGKINYVYPPSRRIDPVYDLNEVTGCFLKKNDLVVFDYRKKNGEVVTRRGSVEDIDYASVLVFDWEAEDHQTGKPGAYRRALRSGMYNVYVLTDRLPF